MCSYESLLGGKKRDFHFPYVFSHLLHLLVCAYMSTSWRGNAIDREFKPAEEPFSSKSTKQCSVCPLPGPLKRHYDHEKCTPRCPWWHSSTFLQVQTPSLLPKWAANGVLITGSFHLTLRYSLSSIQKHKMLFACQWRTGSKSIEILCATLASELFLPPLYFVDNIVKEKCVGCYNNRLSFPNLPIWSM